MTREAGLISQGEVAKLCQVQALEPTVLSLFLSGPLDPAELRPAGAGRRPDGGGCGRAREWRARYGSRT